MLLKCSKVQIKLWINFENKLNRVLMTRHYLEETWASYSAIKGIIVCQLWPPSALTSLLTYFSGDISNILFWQTFLSDPPPPPPPTVLPIIAHTWKPHPEMGTFCSLQVYKMVGIHQLKYINWWRNLPFWSVKGPKRANRCISWVWKRQEYFLDMWVIHL